MYSLYSHLPHITNNSVLDLIFAGFIQVTLLRVYLLIELLEEAYALAHLICNLVVCFSPLFLCIGLGQTTCEFSKFMLIVISTTSFMVDNLFIIPYY